jgi:hypothetical protein
MHIGQFVLSWTANLSFSRDEQIPFKDFSIAMLNFLRDDVPGNWRTYCDEVTDNFRVIDPKKFRIIV